MGARGDRCGGLLSFLLPPSRRLALTAGRADGVGGQFPIAADEPAILQDGDVLAFHEEVEQPPVFVQGRTTAPVGAVLLAAGQLVPLDTDHIGAGSELLERGGHEGERAGAVDRRGCGGLRPENLLVRSHDRLLDHGRGDRNDRSRQRLVDSEPGEDQDQEQDQRNAHVQRPGLHGPEKPVAVLVGLGERIGRGGGHGGLGG